MKIIIGLGNPGKKYENNRHNVGFIILDSLKNKLNFSGFEFNKKFNALIAEKIISEENEQDGFWGKLFSSKETQKTILVKPQTFMNNSGQTVRAILDFYKASPSDLLIINDDLDIIVGKYKIALDSSARGHNGVQSIIENIGTQSIKRLKIGVEKETGHASRQIPGKKFVLEDFTPEELNLIDSLTNQIVTEII